MQCNKVRFPASGDRARQVDQVSIRGTFPQCTAGGVMGCGASVTLAPGFDVFDRILLLFTDGAT